MVAYPDFDAYWRTQTPVFHPLGKLIASLSDADRTKLIDIVRGELPVGPDGGIAYSARANALKARA